MVELEASAGRWRGEHRRLRRAKTPALLAGVGMIVVVAFMGWSVASRIGTEAPSEASSAALEWSPERGLDRIGAASSGPACPEAPPPEAVGGELEVALFLGAGVASVRADEALSAIARFYGAHAIEVHASAEVVRIANESMFEGGFAELQLLDGSEQARAAWLYRDLRAFLITHASPRRGRVNVVVVRDIVHPKAAAASVLGDLVGLTLASELLTAGDGDEASAPVLALMELDDFTPTVFLSDRHLSRMDNLAFETAVAHEVGHALGLVHVPERWNLMALGRHGCMPGLDGAQIDRLRARGPASE